MPTAKYLFFIQVLAAATMAIPTGQAAAARTQIAPTCTACHQADVNTLWGFLKGGSQGDTSFQVQVDQDVWDISYDTSTKLAKNLTTVKELANGKLVMVKFKSDGGKTIATDLSYKTPRAFNSPDNMIEVDDLVALLKKDPKQSNYMVLDVRGISNYEEGHLPGAVAVPNYRFDKFKDRLPKDKDTLLVTYCNGYTCSMSPGIYRTLTEGLGYKNVKMFSGGTPTWLATGQPVVTEPEFLKYLVDNGKADSYVLVDLRSRELAVKEHIANAINLPGAAVKEVFEALPRDKKARIVLYAETMADAEKVHHALRVNGFEQITVLNGGLTSWKAKGYPVTSNSLLKEVNYKAQLLPGRVGVDEFKAIAKESPADKVVLDVRRPDERANNGKIPGTVNIPVDTLDWRWTELPKDKEIVIHCQDGPRASVAMDVLKEHGIKARYLFASFKWISDGTYELSVK